MTVERAREIARDLYGGNPAAESLVLLALNGATPEERGRATAALRSLDPEEPAPGVVEDLALPVARVLVRVIYEQDRSERLRLANLLGALCREAG